LLLDFRCARETEPEAALPADVYPGGLERARWHIREGLDCFERHFGFRPIGCWPAEGAVSSATVELLGEVGFRWAASGQGVLTNSLKASAAQAPYQYHRPYRLQGNTPALFFRDDTLSDLIGFSYATWHADDAVSDLLHRLLDMRAHLHTTLNAVVSIILDGENAWEHYPENAYHFLSALYASLAEHPQLKLTRFSDCIASECDPRPLHTLVAGSWVYGSLSTWIGDADKNRAWDQLVQAKHDYDQALLAGRIAPDRLSAAARQLGICEASDWFWWYGDYNPAEAVQEFDALFRQQLQALYDLIAMPAPPSLAQPIGRAHGAPEGGGTMRRGQQAE
jgi:alpha-amylase/alpha-mannosidase (GH57 family)